MTTGEFVSSEEVAATAMGTLKQLWGYSDLMPHLEELTSKVLVAAAFRYPEAEWELDRLQLLRSLRKQVDAAIEGQVRLCRDVLGYSWTDIADQLKLSRQGARQRYQTDGDVESSELDVLSAQMELVGAQVRAELARLKAGHEQRSLSDDDYQLSTSRVVDDWMRETLELDGKRRSLTQKALEHTSAEAVDAAVKRPRSR
jgi:hypothetical protein